MLFLLVAFLVCVCLFGVVWFKMLVLVCVDDAVVVVVLRLLLISCWCVVALLLFCVWFYALCLLCPGVWLGLVCVWFGICAVCHIFAFLLCFCFFVVFCVCLFRFVLMLNVLLCCGWC